MIGKNLVKLLIIFLYLIGIYLQSVNYIFVIMIAIILYGFLKIIKLPFELKVIVLFILTYFEPFFQYFFQRKTISVYTKYNNFSNMYLTCLITSLFLSFFLIELKIPKKTFIELKIKNNTMIYIINFVILLYLLCTGIKGSYGNYSDISLSSKIEYSMVFYIITYSYSNTKLKKVILQTSYITFSIICLSFGSRITFIQMIFLVIILNKIRLLEPYKIIKNNMKNLLKQNRSILLIFFSLIFFRVMEKLRNSKFDISSLVLKEKKIIINNQADVIYATNACVGLIKEGIFDFQASIKSIFGMIMGLFIPSAFSLKEANIPVYIQKFTQTGGGGLISGFLYFLGREIIVIIIAIFLGKYIGSVYSRKTNMYVRLYFIIVIVTVFRWYSYSLATLYRMPLYLIIIYFIFNQVNKIQKKE